MARKTKTTHRPITFRAVLMGDRARDTLAELAELETAPAKFRQVARLLAERYDSADGSVLVEWPEDAAKVAA